MTDTKFLEVPLEQLSTSQLADRADSHNSAAYADLSEQDLPEDKFRAGLLEILGGKAEETPVPRVVYIAWNGARTQGFATTEYQLAYEARKGSDSNCFDQDGNRSDLAVTFCDVTSDEDCTIETIHQDLPAEPVSEEVRQLTTSARTETVAKLVVECGGDLWGKHPRHSRTDWRNEVENGDTMLGYWEWVLCRLDEEDCDGN